MARRTTRRSGGKGTGDWMAFISFIAIMLLGLALALSFTFRMLNNHTSITIHTNIPEIIERIAIALALIVPLVMSYREARARSNVWFVLWIIAVILVIILYVLTSFSLFGIF